MGRLFSFIIAWMDAFFLDPQVPRLPPEKTRILDLRAELYPDSRRVRVSLELTPFQQCPYIELALCDPEGNEASSASIIEPMGWKLELTMHIRVLSEATEGSEVEGPRPTPGSYTLTAVLTYPNLGKIDRCERSLLISAVEQ